MRLRFPDTCKRPVSVDSRHSNAEGPAPPFSRNPDFHALPSFGASGNFRESDRKCLCCLLALFLLGQQCDVRLQVGAFDEAMDQHCANKFDVLLPAGDEL
jgi:hypothetical protein